VRLLASAEMAELLGEKYLGPDALDMTAAEWIFPLSQDVTADQGRAARPETCSRIGNLYASEILHPGGHSFRAALPTR